MSEIPPLVNIDDFEIGSLAIGISANIEKPHNPLINVEIIQGSGEYTSMGIMVSPKKLRKIAGKLMKASRVAEKKIQKHWEDE